MCSMCLKYSLLEMVRSWEVGVQLPRPQSLSKRPCIYVNSPLG